MVSLTSGYAGWEQVLIDGNRVYRYLIAMLHREAEKGGNRDKARLLIFIEEAQYLPVGGLFAKCYAMDIGLLYAGF